MLVLVLALVVRTTLPVQSQPKTLGFISISIIQVLMCVLELQCNCADVPADGVRVASIHANDAECDRYSPSDIPPPVHDDLTDISSCISHEDRHAHLVSRVSFRAVVRKSKVQLYTFNATTNKKISTISFSRASRR